MEAKLTPEAINDREELSDTEWRRIKSKIQEVTSSLSHENLKLISNPLLSHPVWQLNVEEESCNHRVYLDVRNGKIVVIGIFDFGFTHSGDEHWDEIKDRI